MPLSHVPCQREGLQHEIQEEKEEDNHQGSAKHRAERRRRRKITTRALLNTELRGGEGGR